MNFTCDKEFKQINYIDTKFPKADYECCVFDSCQMNNVDLSDCNFVECTFVNCDLSSVKLIGTGFRDCRFINCKMLGVHFDVCNEHTFDAFFENCVLDYAVFYRRQMKKFLFNQCSLKEVDFTETNLEQAHFKDSDLMGARFEYANLQKCNFTTSYNYTIDPELNKIAGAKFAIDGLPGLLTKYGIEVE